MLLLCKTPTLRENIASFKGKVFSDRLLKDTIVTGNSHTIGSNNEHDTPDKRIHRTLPNIHNDWQRNRIYTILPEQQRIYIDMCMVI